MKKSVRVVVLDRDRWRCRGCFVNAGELHHIVFRSQGGKDEPGNLITLCPSCHRRAHGTNGRQISPEFLSGMLDANVWGWERAARVLGGERMFVEGRTHRGDRGDD